LKAIALIAARPPRRGRADALVVAGLLRQVGEQVAEPPASEGEEPAVVRAVEEHLGDGERDELGIGELRRGPRPTAPGQEIVQPDVKCGDEGVEVGAHEASLVDVAVATSGFGALTNLPRTTLPRNSESTI
jgi:hypothetical protein